MRVRLVRLSAPAVVLATAAAMPAAASSVGTTMPVTALTVTACAVAATPLAFGTLNQLNGSANDSQTTLVVTCTPGTTYDVGLDAGAHASGGVRHMTPVAGAASIPYVLYTTAGRTTTWGNTVGTDTVNATATVTPTTLTVYGRVPAGTAPVAVGAYADLVTVTVTF